MLVYIHDGCACLCKMANGTHPYDHVDFMPIPWKY